MKRFVEKPDEKGRSYLEDGRYFWNSGIFVFQIGALQEAYRRYLPEMAAALEVIDYDDERSSRRPTGNNCRLHRLRDYGEG